MNTGSMETGKSAGSVKTPGTIQHSVVCTRLDSDMRKETHFYGMLQIVVYFLFRTEEPVTVPVAMTGVRYNSLL